MPWDNNADTQNNGDDQASSSNEQRVPFIIQKLGRGKKNEIKEITRLCIDVFFNEQEEAEADKANNNGEANKKQTPPWKSLQLAYLRNSQQGDILARNAFKKDSFVDLIVARRVYPVPTDTAAKINGNRIDPIDDQIYNADKLDDAGDNGYMTGEMIGYCEVTEKTFGLGGTYEKRDARKKPRPYLGNLSVVEYARQSGVGSKLLDACEEAVRDWNAGHLEIVLQVEEDNKSAIQFYKRRGWEFVFADPTCRRYDTSGFFLRESRITKYAMIKPLDTVEDDGASDLGSSFMQKLKNSFFVQ